MHELSVVNSIIKICEEEAANRNIKKVKNIKLKVGELTGLVPECITYYFDIAINESVLNGAKLIVCKIPLEIECSICSYKGIIDKRKFCCPKCKSYKLQIKKGNEFYIDSMEVE